MQLPSALACTKGFSDATSARALQKPPTPFVLNAILPHCQRLSAHATVFMHFEDGAVLWAFVPSSSSHCTAPLLITVDISGAFRLQQGTMFSQNQCVRPVLADRSYQDVPCGRCRMALTARPWVSRLHDAAERGSQQMSAGRQNFMPSGTGVAGTPDGLHNSFCQGSNMNGEQMRIDTLVVASD